MGENAAAEKDDPLTLDGLEELLEDSPHSTGPTLDGHVESSGDPSSPKVEDTSLGWTLKQAAKILGISVNTVRKRLLSGQLEGIKVESPYGYEWRIYPPTYSRNDSHSKIEESSQGPPSPPPPIVEGTHIDFATSGYTDQSVDRFLSLLESHMEIIKSLHSELARKDRVIERQDEQLKLLTDGHHKRGWFTRFSNWFLGRER